MEQLHPSQGALAPGELAGLFRKLYAGLASGQLEVKNAEGLRWFWLDAGQVRAMETEVEEEKLGQWLVERGLLEREQLALTLLRQEQGELFGDLLIRQGVLEAEQLHEQLVQRTVLVLAKLLFCEVQYRFFPGKVGDPRTCVMDVSTGDLLLQAVRHLVDGEHLKSLVRPKAYVGIQQDPLLRDQKVHLATAEGFLLSRIDGKTTTEQLRRLVPLSEEEFNRALAGLLTAGIVEYSDLPPKRPAPQVTRQQEPEVLNENEVVFAPHEAAEHQRVLKLAAEIDRQHYYRRLGLAPGATQDQIHERFRELARMYHPDRALEPHLRTLRAELARIFHALQDAYETLGDPERRARYDQFLKQAESRGEDFQEEERRRAAQLELARAARREAELLLKAGDYGGALPLLEQAVRFDPQAETLLTLARVELRNPMWGQRALSHLRMAVALDPGLTAAWLEMARIWLRRRQTQNALACVERVLEYDPTNAEALALRRQLR
ncbi:MAG: DnaJ domain-containing protein [Thermoanaerobaculum sp.]|nr:DnaJ domain-containing protein [Thermoanaerobaculum sp.]